MPEETARQTQARLLEVIAHADFEVLPEPYAFVPLALGAKGRDDALARVRDGSVWSELVPVGVPAPPMAFQIFSFHFDPAFDATGFVGWLHSHLARATGVGHIVVCGRSTRGAPDHVRGGIFDYWGCPADAADRVLGEVRALIERGRRPRRAHVGPGGGCLLCEALGGVAGLPLVAEGRRAVAVLSGIEPRARGHCVVFPRRHATRWHDLDDGELAEIATLVKRLALALGVEDYNLLGNNGARAGQTVFHAHVHLVPKPESGAAGLVVEGGLASVDQTGVADELRRRLDSAPS